MNKLPYCKAILEKVSFDKTLLNKEYRKSLVYLSREEVAIFKKWVKRQPFFKQIIL